MKTLILPILLLSCQSLGQMSASENSTLDMTIYTGFRDSIQNEYHYPNNIPFGDGYVLYTVGSHSIPGYNIETRNCSIEDAISLPNGRRVAGLNFIIKEKEDYLGGYLIFENDSTIIVDIVIVPDGDGARFIVKGREFDMELTLNNGMILELENDYSIFNTEGVGVWIIKKMS